MSKAPARVSGDRESGDLPNQGLVIDSWASLKSRVGKPGVTIGKMNGHSIRADSLVLHLSQLGFGVLMIWGSLRSAPIKGKDGRPWPNQRFGKTCMFVLGTAMVGLSLWGFYLDWK